MKEIRLNYLNIDYLIILMKYILELIYILSYFINFHH